MVTFLPGRCLVTIRGYIDTQIDGRDLWRTPLRCHDIHNKIIKIGSGIQKLIERDSDINRAK
jgi:hypothetical protein